MIDEAKRREVQECQDDWLELTRPSRATCEERAERIAQQAKRLEKRAKRLVKAAKASKPRLGAKGARRAKSGGDLASRLRALLDKGADAEALALLQRREDE